MLIIPAIDIRKGKCVRLRQGKADEETTYHDDPVQCAALWQEQGARRLHLVDLDGAFQEQNMNYDIICRIRKKFPGMEIQLGGGIRNRDDARRYLTEVKVDYIIIGTLAAKEPEIVKGLAKEYPQRIYLACDIKEGKIMNQGWDKEQDIGIKETLDSFIDVPLAGMVVTDIKNDGMLSGLDTRVFTQVAEMTSQDIIAAGGVTNLDDIRMLKNSGKVFGVVCGKSIYEGTLDFKEALQLNQ